MNEKWGAEFGVLAYFFPEGGDRGGPLAILLHFQRDESFSQWFNPNKLVEEYFSDLERGSMEGGNKRKKLTVPHGITKPYLVERLQEGVVSSMEIELPRYPMGL